MAKNRYVNTRFWSDGFIREKLNPLDRYLFLYFLTNEKTSICGIYELPLSTIASETGIEKEMLMKMIRRLKGKIYYFDSWVYIRNFVKYQALNASIKEGIEKALQSIPTHVKAIVKALEENARQEGDSLGSGSSEAGTYLNLNRNRNLNRNINNTNTNSAETSSASEEIIKVIDAFREFNPAAVKWYANKTQRASGERLIKTHSLEKVLNVIRYLPKSNRIRYLPTVTSPVQLEDKWVSLESAIMKKVDVEGSKGRGLA